MFGLVASAFALALLLVSDLPRSALAAEVSENAMRGACLFAVDPSTPLIDDDDVRTAMLVRAVENTTRLSGGQAYLVGKQTLAVVSRDPKRCKRYNDSSVTGSKTEAVGDSRSTA